MKFNRSKTEIKAAYNQFENLLDCFTEKIDIIKTSCNNNSSKRFTFDMVWKHIMKVYSDNFSSINNISKSDSDILKDEIILSLYGSSVHYTTPAISLSEWHSISQKEDRQTEFKAFSNKWVKWLKDELAPYTTTYSDGPVEEERIFKINDYRGTIISGKNFVVPITQKPQKSSLNDLFCNYIDQTVNYIETPVYMGEGTISYKIYFPLPQLIYNIITNWNICPLNPKYYYGIKLDVLNNFRRSILPSELDTTPINKLLEHYIIEDLFGFSFCQSLTSIINDRIILRSNREDMYAKNAMLLRIAKRIQESPSRFIRTKIIKSFENHSSDTMLSEDMDTYNLLNAFTIQLLELVFSYFIGYIIDDKFDEERGEEILDSKDPFYKTLREYCEDYINNTDYNKYFEYYNQSSTYDYHLNYNCDALEINLTYCIYSISDIEPSVDRYNTLEDFLKKYIDISSLPIERNDVFKNDYYPRFPFNSIYSQYCYQKEIVNYPITYLNQVQRKVPDFLHVIWDNILYSVPVSYINKTVELRVTNENIDIYNIAGERIAHHIKRKSGDKFVTDKNHIPDNYDYKMKYYIPGLRRRSQKIGKETSMIINKLISSIELNPENYTTCIKLIDLAKRIDDNERFNEACRKALEMNLSSVDDVANILGVKIRKSQ